MNAPRTAAAGAGLVEHLAEEMARRWQQGDRAPAEEYLARHPELWGQPEAALELVYEEIQLRQEGGEEVSAAALLRRFPQWHRELEAMLGCHRLLTGPAAELPEVGEELGDFRLLAELGRGAHGRVFLAAQAALAGRPVVLKLSPREGREHLSLARLQHTHIVPLHSVHDFPGRGLRVLCMPYFGGATLDRVLAALACRPPAERIGTDLARALSECGARKAEGGMADNAAFRQPHSAFVEVVCWVGACLAEALHYARERGLVHLDVKPSNVLLAADGTPMLLDFHLARAPLAAGARAPGTLGGTPGYMAPEHRAALAAACERRPAPEAVDGRADVYALGLLLYEALAGRLPAPGEAPAPALRRLNPRVSPGLADLLAHCLAPLPAQRYASAAEVATDLRRHLADLPLRGVRNRSGAERWRKWRGAAHALPALALALTAAAAGGLALAHFGRQAERARAALAEGEGHLGAGRFDQAGDAFRHGAALADDLPRGGGLAARLRGGLRQSERGLAAAELHAFSERVRPLYGADVLPPAQARAVAAHCRGFWERRALIAERLGPAPGEQVRADLLDVAILGAHLRARLAAPAEAAAARREALEVLAEAERAFGPSCVLLQERRALGQAVPEGAAPAPRGAWEECALGRAYLLAGDVAGAAAALDRALALRPQSLWAHFYRGSCACRLGRYDDAVVAFSVCVALAPESAWCRHNRGLAYAELGRLERAARDYDDALRLDPTLAAAALGRAALRQRQKHHSGALADLERARELGVGGAEVDYRRALVHLDRQDCAAARASLREALRQGPEHGPSRELLARLGQGP